LVPLSHSKLLYVLNKSREEGQAAPKHAEVELREAVAVVVASGGIDS
jgi:hypothetical protein